MVSKGKQFEALKNTNIFKKFFSELVAKHYEKAPKFLSKENSNCCVMISCSISNDFKLSKLFDGVEKRFFHA